MFFLNSHFFSIPHICTFKMILTTKKKHFYCDSFNGNDKFKRYLQKMKGYDRSINTFSFVFHICILKMLLTMKKCKFWVWFTMNFKLLQ